MINKGKIYLGCPYSDNDANIRQARFEKVTSIAGKIMQLSYIVFSPITHSHSIELNMDPEMDRQFWLNQCKYHLKWCDEMWILMLDGWRDSYGIGWETNYCNTISRPVSFLDPSSLILIDPNTKEIHRAP